MMVPFTDDAGDNHLHVVSSAVAPGPGRHVEGAGGGDEVVALARVELKGVRHRREGSETDCEHSGELEKHYNTLLQYLNILETTHKDIVTYPPTVGSVQ